MSLIKKIRIEKGISQENIATALGVSTATVSRWESGEFIPRAEKLVRLAELLGVTTDDLLKNQLAFNAKQSD